MATQCMATSSKSRGVSAVRIEAPAAGHPERQTPTTTVKAEEQARSAFRGQILNRQEPAMAEGAEPSKSAKRDRTSQSGVIRDVRRTKVN